MHTHTQMHTRTQYTHAHTHTRANAHAHKHMHTHKHTSTRTQAQAHKHTSIQAHAHKHTSAQAHKHTITSTRTQVHARNHKLKHTHASALTHFILKTSFFSSDFASASASATPRTANNEIDALHLKGVDSNTFMRILPQGMSRDEGLQILRKFREMDADGSGELSYDEVLKLLIEFFKTVMVNDPCQSKYTHSNIK